MTIDRDVLLYSAINWILDNLDKQGSLEFLLIDRLFEAWSESTRERDGARRNLSSLFSDKDQCVDLFTALGIYSGQDITLCNSLLDLLNGEGGYCDPHKTKNKIAEVQEKWAKEDEVINDGRE